MNKKWHILLASIVMSATFATQVDASSYSVKKGDTLVKIAKAHNTSVHQIKQWNGLKDDKIYVKQNLVVTSKGAKNSKQVVVTTKQTTTKAVDSAKKQTTTKATPAVTAPASTSTKQAEPVKAQQVTGANAKVHEVVSGNTLTNIAKMYGVTVAQIKQWNSLTSDQIKVGQKLSLIPATQQPVANSVVTQPTTTESEITEVLVDSTNDAKAKAEALVKEHAAVTALVEKQLASEKWITVAPTATSTATYEAIIEAGKQLIGTPYVFSGVTTNGFDCSGYVYYLFKQAGIDVPRKSSLNYFLQETTKVKEPVPGDLVFFKNTYIPTVSHVGIYLGDNQFIHASTSKGVEITSLQTKYWQDRFIGFKRFKQVK